MNDKYIKTIEAIDTVIYELIQKEDDKSDDYCKMLDAELILYDLRADFEKLIGHDVPWTHNGGE